MSIVLRSSTQRRILAQAELQIIDDQDIDVAILSPEAGKSTTASTFGKLNRECSRSTPALDACDGPPLDDG